MSRFEIEDGWYIIVENYDYAIGKYKGNDKKGRAMYNIIGYYATPEKALVGYIEYRQRMTMLQADTGDLRDMVDILSSERKRLLLTVRRAFSHVIASGDDLLTPMDEDVSGDQQLR